MARKSGRSIVILNGSPRVRGNTAVVVGWLERELQKRGFAPVRHDLYRLHFAGCAHCDSCDTPASTRRRSDLRRQAASLAAEF